jgi:hypothetical protein
MFTDREKWQAAEREGRPASRWGRWLSLRCERNAPSRQHTSAPALGLGPEERRRRDQAADPGADDHRLGQSGAEALGQERQHQRHEAAKISSTIDLGLHRGCQWPQILHRTTRSNFDFEFWPSRRASAVRSLLQ